MVCSCGDDAPKSLRDNAARVRREQMLYEPHIRSLTEFSKRLCSERAKALGVEPSDIFVPYFDPCDGGIHANSLFLFEKPGPQTDGRNGGSGFVSRNNNDQTAFNTLAFMKEAKLQRKNSILWNIIPWWNGRINYSSEERKSGILKSLELIEMLEQLRVIVLVGAQAKRLLLHIGDYINGRCVEIICSPHPSPQNINRRAGAKKEIVEAWGRVSIILSNYQSV